MTTPSSGKSITGSGESQEDKFDRLEKEHAEAIERILEKLDEIRDKQAERDRQIKRFVFEELREIKRTLEEAESE